MNGERPDEGVVIVRGSGEGFAQEIVAGSHRFLSDEPPRAGGTDTGPTPYDLLLASLGSCTSMTLVMSRATKAVATPARHDSPSPLTRARVAEDCAACEDA